MFAVGQQVKIVRNHDNDAYFGRRGKDSFPLDGVCTVVAVDPPDYSSNPCVRIEFKGLTVGCFARRVEPVGGPW